MDKRGYIYILTNKSNTVLYIGVTNSIQRRIREHKEGQGSLFTQKYNCNKLVYYEAFQDIDSAIKREKRLKQYNRDWKIELINRVNPEWIDLYDNMVVDPMIY